jgi:expansin
MVGSPLRNGALTASNRVVLLAILDGVKRGVVVVGVVVVIAACGSDEDGDDGGGPSRPLSSSSQEGIATFYDADGSGNCSFEKSPSNLDVAALSMPEYDKSASCGACLRVTGPKGEVTVRVVDSCPPCEKSSVNVDLSASAFAKIAEPKQGRVSIKYQMVSCPTSGNLAYHFKDGSSKYWTAIQIRNHKVPVTRLEYKKGAVYVAMERQDYNYFIDTKGVGDQPNGLTVRLQATDGQVIEETLSGTSSIPSNKVVQGTKQFE